MRVESIVYMNGVQQDGSWICPICQKEITGTVAVVIIESKQHLEQHDFNEILKSALEIQEKHRELTQ